MLVLTRLSMSNNYRDKFPMVLEKASLLTSALLKVGPEQSIDVDNAGMRLALDVVALVIL